MIDSYEFLKLTIDAITEHIVVIDSTGLICFVNRSWISFGDENNCGVKQGWEDVNYLSVCDDSANAGETFGRDASNGIRALIKDGHGYFRMEYPCHSETEQRWFMMTVTPFQFLGMPYFVISHQDISKRKKAEEEVSRISLTDGLTKVPNRRCFDEFLDAELHRCARSGLPLSLAMIDVDHFKYLNDRNGHLAGDECLIKIGELLKGIGKRPGDICARYGGEEFVYVFGNTTLEQALVVINKLMDGIRELGIPNQNSPVLPTVTVSVGLASIYPDAGSEKSKLIDAADKMLYLAKNNGRNRVEFG